MTIRNCVIAAVEGTQASGKTTLAHALTAHYRAQGMLVDCVAEPARTSPFIEEIVVHGRGKFDLVAEVDLFAAQLSSQLRASRHQELLICDKTIVNVLAYAHLVLHASPDSHEASTLEAMAAFCRAWVHIYDAVFYCPDHFAQPGDPFRAKVGDLQDSTATAVREACELVRLPLIEVPSGLDVAGRVQSVASGIDRVLTATREDHQV